jgi:hypothetical protein
MLSLILANWKTSLAGLTALMIVLCDTLGIPIPAKNELLGLVVTYLGLSARDANK